MDPARKRSRTRLLFVLIFAVGWTTFLYFYGPRRSSSLDAPDLEGMTQPLPADFAWRLVDLDGKPVDFTQFRGQPILLNLWATWCDPCLNEMPSIANLASEPRLKDKKIAFICVSTDQDAETLRAFARSQGKDWAMTMLRTEPANIPPIYQTDGIPATFLISPEGKIVAAQVGAARWDDPAVVSYLDKLAAQIRPKP